MKPLLTFNKAEEDQSVDGLSLQSSVCATWQEMVAVLGPTNHGRVEWRLTAPLSSWAIFTVYVHNDKKRRDKMYHRFSIGAADAYTGQFVQEWIIQALCQLRNQKLLTQKA